MIDLTGPTPRWNPEAQRLWLRSVREALRDDGAWATSGRTGAPALREALASDLGMPTDDLSVTSGIRGQVASLLAGAGRMVIERPTFLSVPRLAERLGVPVVALEWEDIFDGGAVPGKSVVWITSPARNPDGRTLTRAEADRLDELAEAGHRVVVNQAYHWCAPDAPRPRRAILVGSLHKVAGGGTAVGWQRTPGGAGPDRPAAGGPPTAWQHAWAAFVRAGGLALLTREALWAPARRCRRFAQLVRLPSGAGLRYGDGPSLSLLLPEGITERAASARLSARGLAVGEGAAFGWPRPAVRLSFTGVRDDEVDRCVAGVEQALGDLLPA